MKRTIKSLGVALAPAALIPLMVACQRPAQSPGGNAPTTEPGAPSGQQQPGTETPKQGATGPTSELGMPGQGAPGAEMQHGQQPGQEAQPGQQGPSGLGSGLAQQQQQGQMGEQPTPGGETGAPTGMNERALCDALATSARLRIDDVQNGVVIVATPKAGNDLATVREQARRLENSIRTGGGEAGAQHGMRAGESCGIAELGRLPSVSTQLTETGNSVRIMMTTNNAAEVRDLRRIARDELNALTKSQGGVQRGQPGGQRPGGRGQRPGGAAPIPGGSGQQQMPGGAGQQGQQQGGAGQRP
jgi:hypothetical protein